jgi:hypothetical protein
MGPEVSSMTTMALLDLVDDGGADISEVHDGQAVVELLRVAAAAGPNQTRTLFSAAIGEPDTPNLTVGLSEDGRHGWLTWWDGKQSWVPQATARTGHWVDYWCVDQHMQVDEGQQLPAAIVLDAIREYVTTHQRPVGIQWKHEK